MRFKGEHIVGNPNYFSIGIKRIKDRASIIFAPDPPSPQTLLTLMAGRRIFPKEAQQLIAVTKAPSRLKQAQEVYLGKDPTGEDYAGSDTAQLVDQFFQRSPDLDNAVFGTRYADNVIYMMPDCTADDLVEAIGLTSVREIPGIYPNNHYGMERLAAEVASKLSEHTIAYPPPEVIDTLESKIDFHKLQQELGFRVPLQSPPIATGSREEDKKRLLEWKDRISLKTGKQKVAIKASNLYGSQSFYTLDSQWSEEKQERIVKRHLQDRNEGGSDISIVEEFMEGIDVGIFVTTSGGKININYTRKGMSKGPDGIQSEEIRHTADPHDPINELCKKIFTPRITAILKATGADKYTMTYNADGLLDKRYFDQAGNVITTELLDEKNDDSYIQEVNTRAGGTGVPTMFDQVYEADYHGLMLQANLGDSGAIDTMNGLTPRNAAIIEVTWAEYQGDVIKPPYPMHLEGEAGVFYVRTLNNMGVGQGLQQPLTTIELTEDYRQKGERPVIGTYGKTIYEAQARFDQALELIGMVVLTEKGIRAYRQDKTGQYGYVERPVDPGSNLARFLKEENNCVFVNDKWQLASSSAGDK